MTRYVPDFSETPIAKLAFFFGCWIRILRYAAVKAIGGLNLPRGCVGGRPPLGTEKTGIILANIKTAAEAQPFIS